MHKTEGYIYIAPWQRTSRCPFTQLPREHRTHTVHVLQLVQKLVVTVLVFSANGRYALNKSGEYNTSMCTVIDLFVYPIRSVHHQT